MLSVRVCGRYTGGCGYCSLPTGDVCYHEWPTTNHANSRSDVSGVVLREQGSVKVGSEELTYAVQVLTGDSAGLIIAGWDERHGGQVYSIPLGGSLHKQSYAIGGSGSTYIYGYCDANWKEGMEEEAAVNFVKGALQEAIKWDGSSGGVIRMVVLTKKGANRHLYLPDTDYAVRHQ